MKGYVVAAIILAAILMIGALYLNLLTLTAKSNKTFNEVYEEITELTFKVGENSTISQHFKATAAFPNGTKRVLTDSTVEFRVKNLTWPFFDVCLMEKGKELEDCRQIYFPYVALPVEILGVKELVLPFGSRGMPMEFKYDGLDSVSFGDKIYTVYKYVYEFRDVPEPGAYGYLYLMYDVDTGALIRAETKSVSSNANITMEMSLTNLVIGEEHVMTKPKVWPWSGPQG